MNKQFDKEKYFVRKLTLKQRLYNAWVNMKNLFRVKFIELRIEYLPEELGISEEEWFAYCMAFNIQLLEHISNPKFYRATMMVEGEESGKETQES